MLWVLKIMIVGVFVAFYVGEGHPTVREWRLRLFGRLVTGRVTKVAEHGYKVSGTVRYTVERRKHTVSGYIDPRTTVGQAFPVRYLPSKPHVATLSEGVPMLLFKTVVVIFVTAILIFLALSVLFG